MPAQEKKHEVSSDDVAAMKAMLSEGKTLRQIAQACGLCHVTVRSKLLKAKAVMKKRGRKPVVTGAQVQPHLQAGLSHREIAEKLGVSESAICRAAARLEGKD